MLISREPAIAGIVPEGENAEDCKQTCTILRIATVLASPQDVDPVDLETSGIV